MRIGLCSVTFRALPPARVLELAAAAGLHLVEWGADVHAPPDDALALRGLREQTTGAGLAVSSYGSYWRAGADDLDAFARVAEAAAALGAPRIRVWAGTEGSAATGRRAAVVSALREAAGIAAGHGITVAAEFHTGTLTDTPESARRLLEEVGHPALSTYWQPPPGVPDAEAVEGLATVLDHVSAVHVFSWWPGDHRLPLSAREGLWRQVIALVPETEFLLEFVPDDDPGVLAREAATLRSWLG